MPEKSQTDKILFIGGHRKSGTSMVRDLFDGHSDVSCYPPDLTVLYAYFPQFLKDHHEAKDLIDRLDRIVVKELELSYKMSGAVLPAPISKFKECFFDDLSQVHQLKDMQKIITRIFSCYKNWSSDNKNQKNINVIKETSIEIYAQQLFNWFPDAQFLQIMRDPRDNYAALKAGVEQKYKKYGEDEHVTLLSLINRLGTSMRMGLINQKIYDGAHYNIVKFEDITSMTQPAMEKICQWLNMPFEETLLTPSKFSQSSKGNNFDGKDFSKISNAHVGAWKDRITEEEAKIIEFYLGDLMQEYGYNLAFSKEQTIEATSTFYQWSNYQYFYFDRFKNEELSE